MTEHECKYDKAFDLIRDRIDDVLIHSNDSKLEIMAGLKEFKDEIRIQLSEQNKRISIHNQKLQALLAFKWKSIGAIGGLLTVITIVINILAIYKK